MSLGALIGILGGRTARLTPLLLRKALNDISPSTKQHHVTIPHPVLLFSPGDSGNSHGVPCCRYTHFRFKGNEVCLTLCPVQAFLSSLEGSYLQHRAVGEGNVGSSVRVEKMSSPCHWPSVPWLILTVRAPEEITLMGQHGIR